MDNIGIANVGIASVAAITVICYLVGLIVKASGLNDKYIPICCGVAGAALAAAGVCFFCLGIVSGLAATGINQMAKQLSK